MVLIKNENGNFVCSEICASRANDMIRYSMRNKSYFKIGCKYWGIENFLPIELKGIIKEFSVNTPPQYVLLYLTEKSPDVWDYTFNEMLDSAFNIQSLKYCVLISSKDDEKTNLVVVS